MSQKKNNIKPPLPLKIFKSLSLLHFDGSPIKPFLDDCLQEETPKNSLSQPPYNYTPKPRNLTIKSFDFKISTSHTQKLQKHRKILKELSKRKLYKVQSNPPADDTSIMVSPLQKHSRNIYARSSEIRQDIIFERKCTLTQQDTSRLNSIIDLPESLYASIKPTQESFVHLIKKPLFKIQYTQKKEEVKKSKVFEIANKSLQQKMSIKGSVLKSKKSLELKINQYVLDESIPENPFTGCSEESGDENIENDYKTYREVFVVLEEDSVLDQRSWGQEDEKPLISQEDIQQPMMELIQESTENIMIPFGRNIKQNEKKSSMTPSERLRLNAQVDQHLNYFLNKVADDQKNQLPAVKRPYRRNTMKIIGLKFDSQTPICATPDVKSEDYSPGGVTLQNRFEYKNKDIIFQDKKKEEQKVQTEEMTFEKTMKNQSIQIEELELNTPKDTARIMNIILQSPSSLEVDKVGQETVKKPLKIKPKRVKLNLIECTISLAYERIQQNICKIQKLDMIEEESSLTVSTELQKLTDQLKARKLNSICNKKQQLSHQNVILKQKIEILDKIKKIDRENIVQFIIRSIDLRKECETKLSFLNIKLIYVPRLQQFLDLQVKDTSKTDILLNSVRNLSQFLSLILFDKKFISQFVQNKPKLKLKKINVLQAQGKTLNLQLRQSQSQKLIFKKKPNPIESYCNLKTGRKDVPKDILDHICSMPIIQETSLSSLHKSSETVSEKQSEQEQKVDESESSSSMDELGIKGIDLNLIDGDILQYLMKNKN